MHLESMQLLQKQRKHLSSSLANIKEQFKEAGILMDAGFFFCAEKRNKF
jgi:hypothetical protein